MENRVEPLVIAAGDHGLVFHSPKPDPNAFGERVDVKAGPFTGSFEAHCYSSPWQDVLLDLSQLLRSLKGTTRFYGYEEISVVFMGDGLGHIQAKVEIREHPLRLSFEIELDQTHLPGIIAGIERVFL